jgi:hypothetical protein
MKMKTEFPKLLLIVLMFSFLCFTAFFFMPVHATPRIPSGIVYYVPVTLTNSQDSAVSIGSQVSITVNWDNYVSYLDNPVDNYAFFNSAGTTLNSWLESGTANNAASALLWLKIDSSIAANGGTYTVYLGFYAKGTNVLSPSGGTGWAPQLSRTYGEYDNGANVFPVYFNGNSDLSNFQVDPYSGDSVARVSTALGSSTINAVKYTLGDNESSNDGMMYTGQNVSASQNMMAESSFSSDGGGTDMGAIGLGTNDGPGVAANFISTSTQYSGAYFDQAFDAGTFSQNYVDFNQQGFTTTAWRYASIRYNSTTSFYGYIAPQLYSISGGYDGTVNYADQGLGNPFAGASNLYLFFYADVGAGGAWIQYNWARARLYPPNGVMPSSSFGSARALISITGRLTLCIITVTQGANGVIAPGTTYVNYGGSQSFTITANTGYHIADVFVNRTSVGAVSSYTFTDVHAAYVLSATFSPTSTPTPTARLLEELVYAVAAGVAILEIVAVVLTLMSRKTGKNIPKTSHVS